MNNEVKRLYCAPGNDENSSGEEPVLWSSSVIGIGNQGY
jgi:hypothetical protein